MSGASPVASKFAPAPVRGVASVDDCDFYHTVDIPGHGEISGQWDLRGHESTYLGDTPLAGKSVLEIGPASGHLSFWMESQGADVSVFELGIDNKWDFVPFESLDMAGEHARRKVHLGRLHNSWWFLRAALKAKAQAYYGTVYDIDPSLGRFDVVTLNSILLHLRNPLQAIENAASVCGDTIIITDVAEEQFAPLVGGRRAALALAIAPELAPATARGAAHAMTFIPRAAAPGGIDAWFFLPSTLVAQMLQILGFETTITKHSQAFMDGPWQMYTVVGKRR